MFPKTRNEPPHDKTNKQQFIKDNKTRYAIQKLDINNFIYAYKDPPRVSTQFTISLIENISRLVGT